MDERTYAEKLRDPRWQKMRLKVFERDGWACTACGNDTATLHVHHKLYEYGRDPWEYSPDNLMTLCEPCHTSEYNDRHQAERRLLTELKRAGFLAGDLSTLADEAAARTAGDFQRTLVSFLTSFELVFGSDWDYSRLILQSDGFKWHVTDRGTFLEPGVEDEFNNWGNRGGLLASYRRLLGLMEQMGMRTNDYFDMI